MTDKIIEAAREAGGTTYTNRHYPGETACAFGPEALARFYAIAYKQGLEDLAARFDQPHMEYFGTEIAEAAQELKEQQHG